MLALAHSVMLAIALSAESGINDVTKGEMLAVGRVRMDSVLFVPSGGDAPPAVALTVTV